MAAFIKRMARLSLTSTPSGILIALTFIYNLLIRHPSCMCLIHRDITDRIMSDPYNYEEKEPSKSHALESSLWEIMMLKNHYCPQVVRIVNLFEKPFKQIEIPLTDCIKSTYSSVSHLI
jgi:U3 small nucleolar RNA-associated protein 19